MRRHSRRIGGSCAVGTDRTQSDAEGRGHLTMQLNVERRALVGQGAASPEALPASRQVSKDSSSQNARTRASTIAFGESPAISSSGFI